MLSFTIFLPPSAVAPIRQSICCCIKLFVVQQRAADTGLRTTGTNAGPILVADAVSGITKLRDNLAGTAAENALTRNTVAQGGTTSTTGPDLFAADSDAIAFTRTPSQVTLFFPTPLAP